MDGCTKLVAFSWHFACMFLLFDFWRTYQIPTDAPEGGIRIMGTHQSTLSMGLQLIQTLAIWLALGLGVWILALASRDMNSTNTGAIAASIGIMGSVSETRWVYLRLKGQVSSRTWALFSDTHFSLIENMRHTSCSFTQLATLEERVGSFSHRLEGKDTRGKILFRLPLDAFTVEEIEHLLLALHDRTPQLSSARLDELRVSLIADH